MSYCIAVIHDDAFEEPFVVLGPTLHAITRSLAAYAREARVVDGKGAAIEVAQDALLFDWAGYAPTLLEALEQCDSLTVHLYGLGLTDDPDTLCTPIETPSSLMRWAGENAELLRTQHGRPVVDVKVAGAVL